MYTKKPKPKKKSIVDMDRIYAIIDQDLVNYYLSLVVNHNSVKKASINGLVKLYFSNKKLFSHEPLLLNDAFSAANKGTITVRLNPENTDLFTFFMVSNNRSYKQEIEYIIVCVLLTLKKNKIDKIIVDDAGNIKLFVKNSLIKLK